MLDNETDLTCLPLGLPLPQVERPPWRRESTRSDHLSELFQLSELSELSQLPVSCYVLGTTVVISTRPHSTASPTTDANRGASLDSLRRGHYEPIDRHDRERNHNDRK